MCVVIFPHFFTCSCLQAWVVLIAASRCLCVCVCLSQADKNCFRVMAFMKRMAQVTCQSAANFAAAVLYMVSEVLCARSDVVALVLRRAKQPGDVPTPAAATAEASKAGKNGKADKGGKTSNNQHNGKPQVDNKGNGAAAAAATGGKPGGDVPRVTTSYDATKRDPKYCGVEYTCLWELVPLAAHYHPSVRKFAEQLMMSPGSPLGYNGDPLTDFSVSASLRACCVAVLARGELWHPSCGLVGFVCVSRCCPMG